MSKGDLFLPYFLCKSLEFSIFMCYNTSIKDKEKKHYDKGRTEI